MRPPCSRDGGRRPRSSQERVGAERPTLFFAVPTFYAALLSGDLPDDTFASVRLAASAGEALPGPLLTRFKQRFGVDIIDGIGSTEALHIFLSNSPGDIRPGTTGKAVPGYDVVVVGEDGQPLPAGQPGALRVRGDSIALGYWKRTAASRQVFQGEWLVTGDTYVCDADGYFTCLGRNSDMLKSGGIWVSPAEVESRLIEHPAVREAAVVGVADEHGIDKPVAVVIADGRQRRGPGRLVPRRPRALQGAAPRGVRGRAAQDRDRQAPAVQGPSPAGQQLERLRGSNHVPYVIASACIDVNDKACVDECPVDCIYEGVRKSYINPKECIDCGACEPVCPVEAITQDRRVADGDEPFVEDNATFFDVVLAGRDAPLGMPGGARKVGDLGTDTELVAAWAAD